MPCLVPSKHRQNQSCIDNVMICYHMEYDLDVMLCHILITAYPNAGGCVSQKYE